MTKTPLLLAALPLALMACEPMPAGGDAAATGASENVAASTATSQIPEFTGEDRIIWNSLSDQAKAEALEYIANGGTLKQFVQQGV